MRMLLYVKKNVRGRGHLSSNDYHTSWNRYNIGRKSPIYKRAVQFSIKNSEFVTAVSNSLKKDTVRLLDVDKPINVIPNFIDLSKIINSKIINKEIIASKNQFVITHISNFRPLKRVIDVLKVFKRIRKKFDVKLIMVGDGPEKQKAKRFCKTNDINEAVIFLETVMKLIKYYLFQIFFYFHQKKKVLGL